MPKDAILEDMQDRLSEPWTARGSLAGKCFITLEELRTAWSGKLETFAKEVGLGLAKSEFGIVEGRFLKMLSILVMIRSESLSKFKKNFLDHKDGNGGLDRTDECLPISQEVSQNSGLDLHRHEARLFEMAQYQFIPIILKQELEPLVLKTPRPLPFVDPDPPFLGSGAYGSVYKEVIAARCLILAEGSEYSMAKTVARKTMEPQAAKEEIENLIKCRESDILHKNIMTYLCIYQTEDRAHILYDCAETDLGKLLHNEKYQFSIGSSASIIPLLSNASALAKALQFLHSGQWNKKDGSWIGCHMDLKPSNILIVKTERNTTWKISDLGISRFQGQSHLAAKGTTKTYARRSNGKYQAPEVHSRNKIGRKSDIWSMGCILIVITIRAVQSLDGLTKFTEALSDRYDDDFFHYGGRLKPEVDAWLSKLALKDGPYVIELTNTLEAPAEDVAEILKSLETIIRAMLKVEDNRRCDAEQVCAELENLSRELAAKSNTYPGMKRDIEAALDLQDPDYSTSYNQASEITIPLTQSHPQRAIEAVPETLQNILPEAHSFAQKALMVKMTEDKAIPSFQVAQRTQSQLRDWLKTPGSALLCVSGSGESSSMALISKCVYAAACAHSWTAITYIIPQSGEPQRTPRDLLCRLTNSFISQLLNDEHERKKTNAAKGLQQLRIFGPGDEDLSEAIQKISELLAQRTVSCIFLIDNFGDLCPRKCEEAIKGHWHNMLQVFQRSSSSKQQKSLGIGFKSFVRATGNVEMMESLGATIVRVDGNGPSNVNLRRSLDSCF